MFKARRLPGFVDTPLTRGHRDAMPFLLSPGRFAALAARAIAGGGSYQVIPWQMARVAKLLPDAGFDALLAEPARARPGQPTRHEKGPLRGLLIGWRCRAQAADRAKPYSSSRP